MIDRRSLLRHSMRGAALAAISPALARAAAIGPDRRGGGLGDIDHIVVLMQENRSFDHYFGTMPGVRGFGDRFPIPVAGVAGGPSRTVWDQYDGTAKPPRVLRPFRMATREHFELMRVAGTPHNWPDAQAAWDHGRMGHWPEAKTQRAMAHYGAEDLPFQFAMADAFTLCDAYHCSMQTGTNCNRLFQWTGTNDPFGRGGGPTIENPDDDLAKPDAASSPRFFWTTYPERLEAAGVSWAVYQDMADNFTDNPLANFLQFRAAYRGDPGSRGVLRDKGLATRALDALRADCLADRLPSISWIVGTAEGSEHPGPSSPAQGAAYTAQVIAALTANPKVWARTALFINFDENDGFFDHVPPPAPPSPDAGGFAGASTVSTDGEYHRLPAPGAESDRPALRGRPYGLGPRVPMYVLSPWTRGGRVFSEVADHTSVLRFMTARFGVDEPNISAWRRAVCSDLVPAFDFAQGARPAALTRSLIDTMAEAPARRAAAQAIAHQPRPGAPEDQPPPRQAAGIRPAVATRYRPEVHGAVEGGAFRLTFTAEGGLGVVFHVYDRLRLDAIPRRYTVEPGKMLHADWPLDGERGYDLFVLGPAGFHRLFVGSGRAEPVVTWRIVDAGASGKALRIEAKQAGGVQVAPGAYHTEHTGWTPEAPGTHAWPLAPTHGWYDLILTAPGGWRRRLAGCVAGPWAAISDPAQA
ncbi:phospholipase C, phosphocholine-specific [Sphingomonas sp. H39-1-10]|uniref:phosphocholine-specific phospholipase C n=1 Tax=Sphingomonas pollutisoli TaxID=3030829 RepID=UPI0023B99A3E|nr:phospholipase C, phosphocholine-specific [Sphingomonas pollutisoli]MDF0488913.1 phospholipase C, phosphocholine-specific [Sphingomonas pollutisoli]